MDSENKNPVSKLVQSRLKDMRDLVEMNSEDGARTLCRLLCRSDVSTDGSTPFVEKGCHLEAAVAIDGGSKTSRINIANLLL